MISLLFNLPTSMRRLSNKIAWSGLALILVLCCGSAGYRFLFDGNVTWVDSLYMTFITVTTVGFGEIIDMTGRPEARIFTMILATAGISTLWIMFSAFTALVLENDINQAWRVRKMENRINKLRRHYIICGFGRVGRNVAQELDKTERRYVAIEEDLEAIEQHSELRQPDLLYLAGDASEDDTLKRANIEHANGVFAVTGDDSRNLMIVFTARQLNPKVRIVARCHEIRNVDKMTRAGADTVISPDFSGGMRIASAMVRPNVVSFLDEMLRVEHQLRVEEIPVPEGFKPCPLAGCLSREHDFVLMAIRTAVGWVFNPKGEFIVEPGHVFIVMCSPQGRKALREVFAARPASHPGEITSL